MSNTIIAILSALIGVFGTVVVAYMNKKKSSEQTTEETVRFYYENVSKRMVELENKLDEKTEIINKYAQEIERYRSNINKIAFELEIERKRNNDLMMILEGKHLISPELISGMTLNFEGIESAKSEPIDDSVKSRIKK